MPTSTARSAPAAQRRPVADRRVLGQQLGPPRWSTRAWRASRSSSASTGGVVGVRPAHGEVHHARAAGRPCPGSCAGRDGRLEGPGAAAARRGSSAGGDRRPGSPAGSRTRRTAASTAAGRSRGSATARRIGGCTSTRRRPSSPSTSRSPRAARRLRDTRRSRPASHAGNELAAQTDVDRLLTQPAGDDDPVAQLARRQRSGEDRAGVVADRAAGRVWRTSRKQLGQSCSSARFGCSRSPVSVRSSGSSSSSSSSSSAVTRRSLRIGRGRPRRRRARACRRRRPPPRRPRRRARRVGPSVSSSSSSSSSSTTRPRRRRRRARRPRSRPRRRARPRRARPRALRALPRPSAPRRPVRPSDLVVVVSHGAPFRGRAVTAAADTTAGTRRRTRHSPVRAQPSPIGHASGGPRLRRSASSRSSSGASVVRWVIASATARCPACSAISRCISRAIRR